MELYFDNDDDILFDFDKTINESGTPDGMITLSGKEFYYIVGGTNINGFEKSFKFIVQHHVKDDRKGEEYTIPLLLFSIFYGSKNPDLEVRGHNKIVFHSTFFAFEEKYL